jgi:hypothetical protein
MGRYCWQRLHMSNTQRMTINTAYRVCQTTSQAAGLTSAYYQQWRALTKLGIKHPNPRKSLFLEDLGTFIASHQADGNEILLQLNANTTNTTQEWWEFLESHDLVDLVHGIVSSDPFPNSFASGTTKIDYILGTPKFATALQRGRGHSQFPLGTTF